jgi:hypothetical protein
VLRVDFGISSHQWTPLGFNKYYPPDYDDAKHKSLNSYRGLLPGSHYRRLLHFSPINRQACAGRQSPKARSGYLDYSLRASLQHLVVRRLSTAMSLPHGLHTAERAMHTLAWVFVTMRKRRRSECTILRPYFLSGASAIFVAAGSRSRPIPRFAPSGLVSSLSPDLISSYRTPATSLSPVHEKRKKTGTRLRTGDSPS